MKKLASLSPPMFQLIRTQRNHYLYDTATNKILEISPDIHAFLDKDRFTQDELRFFASFSRRKDGVLSPYRPDELLSIFNEDRIKEDIQNFCLQVSLEVTQSCNLRCRYCIYSGQYEGKRTHVPRFMKPHIAHRAIDYLAAHSSRSPLVVIAFYGGEPLINPSLIQDVVKYTQATMPDREVQFAITTNGTLLNKASIELLASYGFHVFVSLDGPRHIHDKMRLFPNQKGSFDLVYENLQLVKSMYPDYYKSHIHFSMVVSPGTNLVDLDEFIQELEISSAKIATISEFGTCYDEEYKKSPVQNEEYLIDKFVVAAQEGDLQAKLGTPEYCLSSSLCSTSITRILNRRFPPCSEENRVGFGLCVPGNRKIFVDCDGDIYPCEKTDGAQHLLMGNISTDGVQIKKVKKIINSFYTFISECCRDCWLYRLCDACYVQPTWGNGYDANKFQQACESQRRRYARALELYCTIMENNPQGLDSLIEDKHPMFS